MAKNDKQISIEDFSSRIKKVFIELNDYYFYHGPSDESYGDSRLIGRKKLLIKIKSLFLNSEFASGVYLITGYRGSGKTSLINKVISSIDDNLELLKGNPVSYVYAALIFIVLTFFSFLLIFHKQGNMSFTHTHLIVVISCTFILLLNLMIILYQYSGKNLKLVQQ